MHMLKEERAKMSNLNLEEKKNKLNPNLAKEKQ